MPIPVPGKEEKKKDFIARCMGSEVMNKEFPDGKQRFAVCQSKWAHKNKKMKSSEEELIDLTPENLETEEE